MATLLREYRFELVNIFCLPSSTLFNALVEVDDDLAPVFPYLNALIPRCNYSHEGGVLDFMHDGHIVTLKAHEMRVTGLEDEAHARRVLDELVSLVNDAWARREEVEPVYEQRRPPTALDVLRELPRTNCGECGLATCMAFASEVSATGRSVDDCPPLREREHTARRESLRRLTGQA